jgi:hypothetical protein
MNAHPMKILLVEENEDDILLEQEALADVKLVNLMSVVRDGEERWLTYGVSCTVNVQLIATNRTR